MELCNFVYVYYYGGIDWHDAHSEIHQVVENNSPFIKDVRECVINTIISDYENRELNNIIDRNKVVAVYDGTLKEYRMPINVKEITAKGDERISEPEIFENEDGTFSYENELVVTHNDNNNIKVTFSGMWGQFHSYREYCVKQIKTENVVFLSIKSFYRGLKCGDTVECITADYFESYEDAVNFIDKDKSKVTFDNESLVKSFAKDMDYNDYSVVAFDKNELVKDGWYITNINNLKRCKRLNINNHSKLFSVTPMNQKEILDKYERKLASLGAEAEIFDEYRLAADHYISLNDVCEIYEENLDYLAKAYGMDSPEYVAANEELLAYKKSMDEFYKLTVCSLAEKIYKVNPSATLVREIKDYNDRFSHIINDVLKGRLFDEKN